MRSNTDQKAGCDRRILKAFYTQYVAVLLIILVFTVGSFQRTVLSEAAPIEASSVTVEPPAIGAISLPDLFNEEGALVGDHVKLSAIATILKEHDVEALITLPSLPEERTEGALDGILARASTLEGFFKEQGVAESSFEFVTTITAGDNRPVRVDFREARRDKLSL